MEEHFKILCIIGRPAAGKSEIIDYLKKAPADERKERFHIAPFEEIDDFPLLWAWFEEDHILNEMGQPRLHTDAEGYFKEHYLWNLLIRRLDLEYRKKIADNPDYESAYTAIVEFARGTEHGGFADAFDQFSEEILSKMAVMYLDVSWDESLRKNKRRFNPDRPHSILEHGLPEDKMEKLYRMSDWQTFTGEDPEFLNVRRIKVPYAVFENEDDVTTGGGEPMGNRLEETLSRLWMLYC